MNERMQPPPPPRTHKLVRDKDGIVRRVMISHPVSLSTVRDSIGRPSDGMWTNPAVGQTSTPTYKESLAANQSLARSTPLPPSAPSPVAKAYRPEATSSGSVGLFIAAFGEVALVLFRIALALGIGVGGMLLFQALLPAAFGFIVTAFWLGVFILLIAQQFVVGWAVFKEGRDK